MRCATGASQALNGPEEALASYDRAIVLKPSFAEAHFNSSLCLLLAMEQDGPAAEVLIAEPEGLREAAPVELHRVALPSPFELAPAASKIALQQRFGDAVQFCRYATLVAGRGARVVLELPPELRSLPGLLDGPEEVIAAGQPISQKPAQETKSPGMPGD